MKYYVDKYIFVAAREFPSVSLAERTKHRTRAYVTADLRTLLATVIINTVVIKE